VSFQAKLSAIGLSTKADAAQLRSVFGLDKCLMRMFRVAKLVCAFVAWCPGTSGGSSPHRASPRVWPSLMRPWLRQWKVVQFRHLKPTSISHSWNAILVYLRCGDMVAHVTAAVRDSTTGCDKRKAGAYCTILIGRGGNSRL
jgi:hypothetical protein